jgi:putative heme-binding domain-containing protein
LTGVYAEWISSAGETKWSGWLPHFDLDVATALTAGSPEHARLWKLARQAGKLVLHGQLDLWSMLRPALQPGAKLDYEPPPEQVSLAFTASTTPLIATPGYREVIERAAEGATTRLLDLPSRERRWLPLEITLPTGGSTPLKLQVAWSTSEDKRPRALALRRVLVPWAIPASPPGPITTPAELKGGDWQHGKELFAMCAMCHTVRGQGGQVGPDLSNLLYRDYASIRQDIVDPNATLNPNHVASVITLKKGGTITGIVVEDDAERLVLAGVGGPPTIVPKRDVVDIKTSPRSLMPEGYEQALGEKGLKDIITFLMLPPPGKARVEP